MQNDPRRVYRVEGEIPDFKEGKEKAIEEGD